MLAGPPGVLASQPSGTFGVVSVIHFDPFEPEWLAKNLQTADLGDWTARLSGLGSPSAVERGRDTTSVLLLSALAGIAEHMASADFNLFAGDFLGHRFHGMKPLSHTKLFYLDAGLCSALLPQSALKPRMCHDVLKDQPLSRPASLST
jgi:hypothetical protein